MHIHIYAYIYIHTPVQDLWPCQWVGENAKQRSPDTPSQRSDMINGMGCVTALLQVGTQRVQSAHIEAMWDFCFQSRNSGFG